MSVIQSSIAGLSRSEQQEGALNRLSQSMQNAGAAIEQRKQWSVEQGLKNVLGDMPISVMASTMDGQRAMAPYVSAFTGLRGQALQDYMNNLALMPKDITAEQLIAQQYVLHGRNTQGVEAAQSEEDFLRQNASYSKPAQPAQPPQTSAQPAPAPAPAPASAPGGLNEYELKAVSGEAQRLAEQAEVHEWYQAELNKVLYWALPLGVDPEPRPLGVKPGPPPNAIVANDKAGLVDALRKAQEGRLFSQLAAGGPEAEATWTRINEQAIRHLMAEKDDMKRAIPADTAGYQGAPSVGRTYAEAFGQQASGSAKPAPLPTVGSPKPGGGVYNAADINALRAQQEAGQNTGVRGAAVNLSPDMTFREFIIARQNSGVPFEWAPIGEKGTSTDAQLMNRNEDMARDYRTYQATGTLPFWANGAAAGAAPSTPATAQGTAATTAADDDLVQRYYMSTYNKSSYQGPPLSPQETARAKRLVAEDMAQTEGQLRRTWKANPDLQGIEARLAQENVYMLEHIAPGARKEDHPFLSTLYTDWSGLAAKKLEAETRLLNAQAGMSEVEASSFLEMKKVEAATSMLEQLAAIDDAFSKQMQAAVDLLNTEALKPMWENIKRMPNLDSQLDAFAKLAEQHPLLKNAMNLSLQGGSAMVGVELKKEAHTWFSGGVLGLFKKANTRTTTTVGDLIPGEGSGDSDAARLAAEYLATYGN